MSNFIESAGSYFKDRGKVPETVKKLRKNPEIFNVLRAEFDNVVNSFNDFLTWTANGMFNPNILMPNVLKVRELINEGVLPTLTQLETDTSPEKRRNCRKTFKSTRLYMINGELDVKDQTQWKFHMDDLTHEELTAAGLLEIYGEYASRAFPQLKDKQHTVVTALEEILAIFHKDTNLFQKIKKWYTEDEGFSPELIASIR